MFDIDYVFPWVNDQDPVGKRQYMDFCRNNGYKDRLTKSHNCRYRDGGLLKFLFRALDKNMPGLRKIHLIVSNPEQIPDGLDTTKIDVVLHKDIIPAELLPTYNSNVIEMFITRIPDLAEHFIYANDDMIPYNPSQPEEWFDEDGIPKFNMNSSKIASTMYREMISNEGWLLQERLGLLVDKKEYGYPLHGLVPLDINYCRDVLELLDDKIIPACSHFREAKNLTPYIYTDYMFLVHHQKPSSIKFQYLNLKNFNVFLKDFVSTKAQVICINDSANVHDGDYPVYLKFVTAILDKKFPKKCKYEK